jgi:hypothetical protein
MPDVSGLPNPWTTPLVSIPTAGRFLGYGRTAAYEAARSGVIPTVLPGRVSVFALYSMLGAPVPPRPVTPSVRR